MCGVGGVNFNNVSGNSWELKGKLGVLKLLIFFLLNTGIPPCSFINTCQFPFDLFVLEVSPYTSIFRLTQIKLI